MIQLEIDASLDDLAVGLVEAEGVEIGAARGELQARCEAAAARVLAGDAAGGEQRRGAVRGLLRRGGFKPAGRNKPAQEYLLRTLREQQVLPQILNVVDLLNAVSVEAGLPISLVAIDRVGSQLTLRYGRSGERFVFNQAGQELDASGLICLCAGDEPRAEACGSPVKDSMFAKVRPGDRHILACIYAPRDAVSPAELRQWSEQLGQGLKDWCGATHLRVWLMPQE